MAYLCTFVAWSVTFLLEWLLIAQFDKDTGRAGIIAFCVVAVCVTCRYRYLPDNQIRFLTRNDLCDYLLAFGIAIIFSLGLDFYFLCNDWHALLHWTNYFHPGGPVRYAATALIVPVGFSMYFGTFAEAALVNAILPMPAAAETIRKAARRNLALLSSRNAVYQENSSTRESLPPLWIRIVAGTRELGGLAFCSPALYAMYLYRLSHPAYALLVALVWLPLYMCLLAQLHKWQVIRWPFSLFATAIVLLMGWILFLSQN